jgi:hypothetical protein
MSAFFLACTAITSLPAIGRVSSKKTLAHEVEQSNHRDANDIVTTNDWQRVSAEFFSLRTPPGWSYLKLPATDSDRGEFTGDGVTLRFDFGLYASSFSEAREPAYIIRSEVIGGHQAKIVSPKKPGKGATAIYFADVSGARSLCLFGQDLNEKEQALALTIFHTIRFGRGGD